MKYRIEIQPKIRYIPDIRSKIKPIIRLNIGYLTRTTAQHPFEYRIYMEIWQYYGYPSKIKRDTGYPIEYTAGYRISSKAGL